MADPPTLTNETANAWFVEQTPGDWFSELHVLVDRDEIMVVGTLAALDENEAAPPADDGAGHAEQIELSRIEWFREESRGNRVEIALRAEAKFRRKVSWAARCGSTHAAFTHQSVPVMTRLRIDERQILDTLVAAGVARSRSDALAWSVRRLGDHESEWLSELREAIHTVDAVRAKGPT